ncbi:MAG: hypothetical protein AB1695_14320 [Stygiobacter sp.]
MENEQYLAELNLYLEAKSIIESMSPFSELEELTFADNDYRQSDFIYSE